MENTIETKENILKAIEEYNQPSLSDRKYRNSMGCYEGWYDWRYSLPKTFTKEELENMSEQELNNLIKLADNISEGLY